MGQTWNKMDHTILNSMKNCASKWCKKMCTFLFEVSFEFWKMWQHVFHTKLQCLVFHPGIQLFLVTCFIASMKSLLHLMGTPIAISTKPPCVWVDSSACLALHYSGFSKNLGMSTVKACLLLSTKEFVAGSSDLDFDIATGVFHIIWFEFCNLS